MYPHYMCILLCVKLIWCNVIPYTYGQLELWGYMYPQCMWYVKHITVFHTSIVTLGGRCMFSICILCQSYVVMILNRSIVNLSGGYMYMCIVLYVKLIWCNVIPYIYCQLVLEG